MRGTVHLVTPRDAAFLRPLVQPDRARATRPVSGERMRRRRRLARGRRRGARGCAQARRPAREIASGARGDERGADAAVRAYAPPSQPPPPRRLAQDRPARYRVETGRAGLRSWTRRSRRSSCATCAPSARRRRWTARAGRADEAHAVCGGWTWRSRAAVDLTTCRDGPAHGTRPRLLGEYDDVGCSATPTLPDRRARTSPAEPMLARGRYVNRPARGRGAAGTWWLDDDVTSAIRRLRATPARRRRGRAPRRPVARAGQTFAALSYRPRHGQARGRDPGRPAVLPARARGHRRRRRRRGRLRPHRRGPLRRRVLEERATSSTRRGTAATRSSSASARARSSAAGTRAWPG